ncbi:ecdysteroid 22-kinase family protein [Aquihabitans sp. G128]|uniref:phosphotransferase family protein n=1 Tax=Aquihabitans sp. G128 TaxID=2849779 RepID=UPI001C249E7C|nr:oxidoreductase family protein [Aquihabitans sp. G128]QXC61110.1 ecdysteroid 22-kinase family protein [Aquihabitans sp. G128]
MTDLAVPVDDLAPAVITEALRAGGHPVTVTGVEATAIGTGQMAGSYRLALDFDGDPGEVPPTLVAKLAVGPMDKRTSVAGAYRTEVDFYRDLAPTLAVRVPRCWHASVSEDATDFLLLLDDLAPAEQGDQLAGCDVVDAEAAAVNLAGLHGPRWCDPTLADGTLAIVTADEASVLTEVLEPMTSVFTDRFAGRLRAEDQEVLERVPAVAGSWLVGRGERFAPVHGDYRLDNLMFAPDHGPVTALDWQTVSLGLPARDLAFLLATGLSIEDRRAHEDDLVAAYHRALLGHGVTGYDLDACRDDYRYAMLQAPLIIVLGCAVGTPSERGDRMFLAMAERSCAAIRDLDPFALL